MSACNQNGMEHCHKIPPLLDICLCSLDREITDAYQDLAMQSQALLKNELNPFHALHLLQTITIDKPSLTCSAQGIHFKKGLVMDLYERLLKNHLHPIEYLYQEKKNVYEQCNSLVTLLTHRNPYRTNHPYSFTQSALENDIAHVATHNVALFLKKLVASYTSWQRSIKKPHGVSVTIKKLMGDAIQSLQRCNQPHSCMILQKKSLKPL